MNGDVRMQEPFVPLSELRQKIEKHEAYEPIFGSDPSLISQKIALVRSVVETFVSAFGSQGPPDRPVTVMHVPGRLEFLGKHTDYAGGPVMNMAASRGFIAVAAANSRRVCSFHENSREWARFEYRLDARECCLSGGGDSRWVTYPQRTLERVIENFGTQSVAGVDVAFGSDLPPASGMSSSSGLMIMTFLSMLPYSPLQRHETFARLGLGEDRLALAHYLACCENGQSFVKDGEILDGSAGVGTFGGSQDQTAIFTAKPGHLTVNWFCPARWERDVAFPEDLALAMGFSGFRAEKTQKAREAFNRLSARAKAIPEAYNSLRGTSHQWAANLLDSPDAEGVLSEARDKRFLEQDLVGRYKSFFNESRVFIPQAADALVAGRHEILAEVINASHECSKAYLQNISPEIDGLVGLARRSGALAATGFGAGFGGSAYAVIERQDLEGFLARWEEAYRSWATPPYEPVFSTCEPVSCARAMFVA